MYEYPELGTWDDASDYAIEVVESLGKWFDMTPRFIEGIDKVKTLIDSGTVSGTAPLTYKAHLSVIHVYNLAMEALVYLGKSKRQLGEQETVRIIKDTESRSYFGKELLAFNAGNFIVHTGMAMSLAIQLFDVIETQANLEEIILG